MRAKLILMALMVCVAGPAMAEAPQFKDFTFKRMKAPAKGSAPRITVQVQPGDGFAALAPVPSSPKPDAPKSDASTAAKAPSASKGGTLDWFWSALPAPGTGTGATRMEAGLSALNNGSMRAPRLKDLSAIASRHGRDILSATIGTRVSPAFALAVISVESSGRVDAVSHAGASGLMQLMPATAKRFGVADTTVPADNIRGGVAYLDWLLKEFGGDPILALAGYNAGENAVKRSGDVPNYAETRGYVPKVLAAWQVARGLCRTPPQLVSDGCVFITG